MPHLTDLLSYFRRRVGSPDGDGALLRRFSTGDSAAFDEILRRHGNLVYGVCRRVLRQPQDAEDAFQATFLVLARKASSLQGRDTVAGWLYTVARHIALRARSTAARRRELEVVAGEGQDVGSDAVAEVHRRELRPILDEELGRLPEKYRAPLVLCYLEGKTNEEAARLLGWTKGTVSGRLARARDLLRGRLAGRGLGLPATAVAALVAEQATADAAPAALLQQTAKAAALLAAGQALAAVAPGPVVALAQGGVREMTMQRVWKWAAASVLFACLVGAAAVVYHRWRPQPEPAPPAAEAAADRMPAERPAVVVRALYPGASAQVVAKSVARAIEAEVAGVEGAVHMISQCSNDGSYALTITFQAGTDVELAQVLVQNRVALARRALPREVGDITVAKLTHPLLLIAVAAADAEVGLHNLGDLAAKEVVPEVRRVSGAQAELVGPSDSGVRVWLDPDRLASRNLSAAEVAAAITEQNMQVAPGQMGQPPTAGAQQFQLTIHSLGRHLEPEQVGDIVIKAAENGAMVRLKDVARVERVAASPRSHAVLNGRRVALVSVEVVMGTRPADVAAAVRAKIAALQPRLPAGVRLEVVCDLTPLAEGRTDAADFLWLDAVLPSDASTERTLDVIDKLGKRLKEVTGVGDVLALTGPPLAPLSNQGSLLLRLAPAGQGPARAEVFRAVRAVVAEEQAALVRLRELRGAGALAWGAYPVQVAVSGPESRQVAELAEAFAERLRRAQQLTDLFAGPAGDKGPLVQVTINRKEAELRGVALADVFAALQSYGSFYGPDLVGDDVRLRLSREQFPQGGLPATLTVPGTDGKPVPVRELVQVHEEAGPSGLVRLNGQAMATLTGNPAPGVTLAEARKVCEKAFAEARAELKLPDTYRLTWLRELPAGK